MATLTVWKFPTPDGADDAVVRLRALEQQQLIQIHDAATVSWTDGARHPRTRQINNLVGAGAMSGLFWGALIGLIFLVPIFGMALGAAAGAAGGAMADVGIDDDFINKVRDQITPGTSALFLMSSGAVLDKVRDAFPGHQAELISTNLTGDQEKTLTDVFA